MCDIGHSLIGANVLEGYLCTFGKRVELFLSDYRRSKYSSAKIRWQFDIRSSVRSIRLNGQASSAVTVPDESRNVNRDHCQIKWFLQMVTHANIDHFK